MVTVTNIVPEPPQATKRIDPANYVDPHCNTCQRKLDTRQITTAFQCHIEGCMEVCHKAIRCSGIRYAQGEKKKRHGSTKYGFVVLMTLTQSQLMKYNL